MNTCEVCQGGFEYLLRPIGADGPCKCEACWGATDPADVPGMFVTVGGEPFWRSSLKDSE